MARPAARALTLTLALSLALALALALALSLALPHLPLSLSLSLALPHLSLPLALSLTLALALTLTLPLTRLAGPTEFRLPLTRLRLSGVALAGTPLALRCAWTSLAGATAEPWTGRVTALARTGIEARIPPFTAETDARFARSRTESRADRPPVEAAQTLPAQTFETALASKLGPDEDAPDDAAHDGGGRIVPILRLGCARRR